MNDLRNKPEHAVIKKPRGEIPLDIKFDAATFGGQLQNGIKALYNSDFLSDIDLLFGEEKMRAHKFVLYAWSTRFQELLSNEPTVQELRVDLKPDEVPHFKVLLEFMYTGLILFNQPSTCGIPLLLPLVLYFYPLKFVSTNQHNRRFFTEDSPKQCNGLAGIECCVWCWPVERRMR